MLSLGHPSIRIRGAHSSATATTTIVFPLDTLKTRMQNGLAMPPTLSGFYSGYTPAAFYSALGMGLWVGSRNKLERDIRYNGPGKHLLTGAIAGVFVQLPTFPLDTLKKRLQSSDARLSPINEARTLMAEGGVLAVLGGCWRSGRQRTRRAVIPRSRRET